VPVHFGGGTATILPPHVWSKRPFSHHPAEGNPVGLVGLSPASDQCLSATSKSSDRTTAKGAAMDEKLVDLFRQWLKAFEVAQGTMSDVNTHKAVAELEMRIAATPAEGLRGLVVKLGLHHRDSAQGRALPTSAVTVAASVSGAKAPLFFYQVEATPPPKFCLPPGSGWGPIQPQGWADLDGGSRHRWRV
jgi:hypothetical protein